MTSTGEDAAASIIEEEGGRYLGYEYLSYGEQVAIAISPSLSAVLSLLGSGVIIYMIYKDWAVKKNKVKYRFLLCLSIADILNSVWFVAW